MVENSVSAQIPEAWASLSMSDSSGSALNSSNKVTGLGYSFKLGERHSDGSGEVDGIDELRCDSSDEWQHSTTRTTTMSVTSSKTRFDAAAACKPTSRINF